MHWKDLGLELVIGLLCSVARLGSGCNPLCKSSTLHNCQLVMRPTALRRSACKFRATIELPTSCLCKVPKPNPLWIPLSVPSPLLEPPSCMVPTGGGGSNWRLGTISNSFIGMKDLFKRPKGRRRGGLQAVTLGSYFFGNGSWISYRLIGLQQMQDYLELPSTPVSATPVQ